MHPCKPVVVAHPANKFAHIPGRKLCVVVAGVVPDQNRMLGVGVGVVIAGIQLWDAVVSAGADMTDLVANAAYADAASPCHSLLAAYPIHRPSCCPVPCDRYSCGMLVSLSDLP